MSLFRTFCRIGLGAALLASLGACTVVPAYQVGYHRAPSVYVEPYPVYAPTPPRYFDGYGRHRGHGHGHRHRH